MENYQIREKVEVNDRRRCRRRRISWGAVFAGTAVVMAVSLLLSWLGASIGMFILEPSDSQPFHGVFGTVGIWTCVSILIGLACGGYVAGKLSGADGFIHGFVVWSVTMIAGVMLVGSITAGIVRLTGNVVGAAGSVVAGAGSAVGSGLSALGDEAQSVFGDMEFNVDDDQMRSDARQALRRSGVAEFQPEYLRSQYNAVSNDLRRTMRGVMRNPQQAGDVIGGFTDRLSGRIDNFANNVNREDVVSLVANNSNMSRAEAENTVDQYMELIEQGRQQMRDLQQNVQEAAQQWESTKQEILEEADKATNRAAWAGIIWFIALLLGAAASSFAGSFGTKKTRQGYDE